MSQGSSSRWAHSPYWYVQGWNSSLGKMIMSLTDWSTNKTLSLTLIVTKLIVIDIKAKMISQWCDSSTSRYWTDNYFDNWLINYVHLYIYLKGEIFNHINDFYHWVVDRLLDKTTYL